MEPKCQEEHPFGEVRMGESFIKSRFFMTYLRSPTPFARGDKNMRPMVNGNGALQSIPQFSMKLCHNFGYLH